jgi:sporulation protein YlmC with PRC-barrel domain
MMAEHEPTPGEHKLILASRVEHTPVYNREGERIGHVQDLSIDRVTGQVVYAIMSFGGFFGLGKHFHPLPWSALEYDPERSGYLVQMDKAALESAPSYDADELRKLGGAEGHRADLLAYYGQYGYPPI